VALACNHSYSGGGDWEAEIRRISVQVSEIPSQQTNRAWGCISVIPAKWEA
jgi:hypothetical protein